MGLKEDIKFLREIAQINEEYPETNQWRETVPLEAVLNIIAKYL